MIKDVSKYNSFVNKSKRAHVKVVIFFKLLKFFGSYEKIATFAPLNLRKLWYHSSVGRAKD